MCQSFYYKLLRRLRKDKARLTLINTWRKDAGCPPLEDDARPRISVDGLRFRVDPVFVPLLKAIGAGHVPRISRELEALPSFPGAGDLIILALHLRVKKEFQMLRRDSVLKWQPHACTEEADRIISSMGRYLPEICEDFAKLAPAVKAVVELLIDDSYDPIAACAFAEAEVRAKARDKEVHAELERSCAFGEVIEEDADVEEEEEDDDDDDYDAKADVDAVVPIALRTRQQLRRFVHGY